MCEGAAVCGGVHVYVMQFSLKWRAVVSYLDITDYTF